MKLTKRGEDCTKKGQIKKYFTQFTNKDKKRIEEIRIQITDNNLLPRTTKHFNRKNLPITKDDILNCFKSGDVIEVNYNLDAGDKRLLFRSKKSKSIEGQKYNLCLVYSIDNNKIVTAYYNKAGDNHKTLNHGHYWNNYPISFDF